MQRKVKMYITHVHKIGIYKLFLLNCLLLFMNAMIILISLEIKNTKIIDKFMTDKWRLEIQNSLLNFFIFVKMLLDK